MHIKLILFSVLTICGIKSFSQVNIGDPETFQTAQDHIAHYVKNYDHDSLILYLNTLPNQPKGYAYLKKISIVRSLLRSHQFSKIDIIDLETILRETRLSKDSVSTYFKARTYELLGHYNYQKQKLLASLYYLDSADIQYTQIEQWKSVVYNLNMIGTIYQNNNQFERALSYYQRAFNLLKSYPIDDELKMDLLVDMGNLNLNLNDTNEAKFYYKQVIENATGYHSYIADAYVNYGIISQKNNFYKAAKKHYKKAIEIYKKANKHYRLATPYNNLATLMSDFLNNQDSAIYYYNFSKKYNNEAGYFGSNALVYNNISSVYLGLNQLDSALFYTQKALKLGLEYQRLEDIEQSYHSLAVIYHRLNFNDSAYYYETLRSTLKDSIAAMNNLASIEVLEKQFEIDQREDHITQLEREKDYIKDSLSKQNLLIYILTTLIITLVFSIVLIYNNFIKREKSRRTLAQKDLSLKTAEALLKGQENERQQIASQIHDVLGNQLAILRQYYRQTENKNDDIEKVLIEMSEEVRNFSQDLMPAVLKKFGLIDAIEEYCFKSHERFGITIDFNFKKADKINLSQEQEVNIFRIVQDLLRYILQAHEASYILLEITFKDNHMIIHTEDNGSENNINDQIQNYLQNIEYRIQYANGSISRTRQELGSQCTITIPNNQ